MYYIGVDLGTSAVKLLLMEGNGKICNIVSNEYPLSFPQPGWSEQKPEDWWDAVVDGIKKLVDGFDASEVAGISFGGQMHGLVILDENDNVIRIPKNKTCEIRLKADNIIENAKLTILPQYKSV